MEEPTRIQLPQGFVPKGTRLSGIYEIDSPLAKGGMGEVYRGHTIETGDPVAIKLIRSDMADNEAVLAMFRREASALARVHHEAIIRYFVFSLDPGLQRHFLAMELVEGEMLSTIVARGPLPLGQVTRLMTRLAGGLQAAHERLIVHRDLSPDNIIIEGGSVDRARIIDFGIARSTRIGETTVIGSGFAGKYNYVSPEQLGLFGGDVTGRSDIYSLGLVIAQCLLGRAINMGGSQVEVVEKRRRVPDLSEIDTRIRPFLEKMLQPDPANRPVDMAEVAAWRLDAAETKKPSPPPPSARSAPAREAGQRRSPVRTMMLAGGALGILAAGAAVAYLGFFSEGWPPAQTVPVPSIDRPSLTATQDSPLLQSPSLTPAQGPAEQSTVPQQQASIPVPPPSTQPAVDPTEKADRFIRDFDSGDCFLALPTALEAGSAEIDAFSLDRRGFDALDTAFTKALGYEAMIDGGQVAQGQCAALRFIAELRRAGGAKFDRMEISRTALKSGEPLNGSILTAARTMALLVVDDQGKIRNVTDQLSANSGGRRFSLRLTAPTPGRAQPALVIAVGSGQPLAALRSTEALSPTVATAAAREGSGQSGPLTVSAKYFRIE